MHMAVRLHLKIAALQKSICLSIFFYFYEGIVLNFFFIARKDLRKLCFRALSRCQDVKKAFLFDGFCKLINVMKLSKLYL